jgi:hypothetical protein
MLCYEADWLWAAGVLNGTAAMKSMVDGLDALGINHVLVQLYAHSTSNSPLPPLTPPRVSPTPRTPWATADQETLDLDYFRNYESMLEMFAERSMVAHVMFFVGNKNVQWPAQGSAADDIYWRNAMARLAAYPSVVLDVSKEAGSHNAGRPVSYFVDRMRLMKGMNAHRRLLTAHSGFDWTNKCDEAPELCEVLSIQKHFGNGPIRTEAHEYYPFFSDAARNAGVPIIEVEFFYQWGPADGCHFACCGVCTNESGADASAPFGLAATANPESNLAEMRRVMWDHYMAGIAGACWYHDDLGWDILDPLALTAHASAMASLRTLRDFWDGVPRREYEVRVCVRGLQPLNAEVHCVVKMNGASPAAMVLHVRTPGASFELLLPPEPEHGYTSSQNKNCWTGHGCENIDDDPIKVSGPPQCARLCDESDTCDCFVHHPSDNLCWRRSSCDAAHFEDSTGYRVYSKHGPKQRPATTPRHLSPHGFWLDPASHNSTTLPFAAAAGARLQQPAAFLQEAVLSIAF